MCNVKVLIQLLVCLPIWLLKAAFKPPCPLSEEMSLRKVPSLTQSTKTWGFVHFTGFITWNCIAFSMQQPYTLCSSECQHTVRITNFDNLIRNTMCNILVQLMRGYKNSSCSAALTHLQ